MRSGTYTLELDEGARSGHEGGGGTLGPPLVLARAYAPFHVHKPQSKFSASPSSRAVLAGAYKSQPKFSHQSPQY